MAQAAAAAGTVASTATRTTLNRLLQEAKDLHQQTGEKLAEIEALLAGKPGIEQSIAAFKAAYDRAWCGRYAKGRTGAYIWTAKTDVPHLKRLLQAIGLEELVRRTDRYLRSDYPFYTGRRHGFLTFVASVNEWATGAAFTGELELAAPVADCKHKPTCASDQEHTKRKLAEMRS